jgi:hypothetical protein
LADDEDNERDRIDEQEGREELGELPPHGRGADAEHDQPQQELRAVPLPLHGEMITQHCEGVPTCRLDGDRLDGSPVKKAMIATMTMPSPSQTAHQSSFCQSSLQPLDCAGARPSLELAGLLLAFTWAILPQVSLRIRTS